MSKLTSQSGQVLLITLLLLTVAVTVGLALIGRSTTDVKVTNTADESSRAFNAAEAGLEEVLKSGTGYGEIKILSPGVNYVVTRTDITSGVGLYTLPRTTTKGVTDVVWLAAHTADGLLNEASTYTGAGLTLCWQAVGSSVPGVVMTIVYKTAGGVYSVVRDGLDVIDRGNNFRRIPGVTDAVCPGYKFVLTFSDYGIVPSSDKLLALRLRPVYGDAHFSVIPSTPLPLQGYTYESTGTTGSGLARRIRVNQLYRAPSTLFDHVIYSQSSFGHAPGDAE